MRYSASLAEEVAGVLAASAPLLNGVVRRSRGGGSGDGGGGRRLDLHVVDQLVADGVASPRSSIVIGWVGAWRKPRRRRSRLASVECRLQATLSRVQPHVVE